MGSAEMSMYILPIRFGMSLLLSLVNTADKCW